MFGKKPASKKEVKKPAKKPAKPAGNGLFKRTGKAIVKSTKTVVRATGRAATDATIEVMFGGTAQRKNKALRIVKIMAEKPAKPTKRPVKAKKSAKAKLPVKSK